MNKKNLINPICRVDRLEVYSTIGSTQARAKEIASEDPVRSCIIADTQSAGYGRNNEPWESPEGGAYLSLLIDLSIGTHKAMSMAIFCLVNILAESGYDVQWKWPNDIIIDGKKLGGVIVEEPVSGWLAIGVGINSGNKDAALLDIMKDTVSSINISSEDIINRFIELFDKYSKGKVLSEEDIKYLNEKLILKGEKVSISGIEGIVSGVDKDGALLVSKDGSELKFNEGKISKVNYEDTSYINIIAVDIGNTTTKISYIKKLSEITSYILDTYPLESIVERIGSEVKFDGLDIAGTVFTSVVPDADNIMSEYLNKISDSTTYKPQDDKDLDIRISVDNPEEVGFDRICNAYASHHIYGGDVVVVDMGTANTFDVVASDGSYLGGIIAPGLDCMVEGLIKKASKLNDYEYDMPNKIIGTNTGDCLDSGFYHTVVGQIESSLEAIKGEWDKDFKVILTGGSSLRFQDLYKNKYILDNDITIKGLALIYKSHINS